MPWLARLSATTRTIEIKTNPLKLPTTERSHYSIAQRWLAVYAINISTYLLNIRGVNVPNHGTYRKKQITT